MFAVFHSWDLVDQCHKCALNFSTGFSEALSSLEFWQAKGSSQQYLATGDTGGKLHIIEVPRNLRRKIANEENLMRLFYEREIARSKYCRRRMEVRKTLGAKEATGKSNKSVSISAPTDDPNGNGASSSAAGAASTATSATSASAAAAQQLKDDKANELAAKEKADKLRQQEEERAEKEYQRLFDQFRSSLQPEDMRQEPQQAHGSASQMRK